jgi:hypothetical protein
MKKFHYLKVNFKINGHSRCQLMMALAIDDDFHKI